MCEAASEFSGIRRYLAGAHAYPRSMIRVLPAIRVAPTHVDDDARRLLLQPRQRINVA
jgi:hypothetical protein